MITEPDILLEEKVAMLHSIVSTYPPSVHNGSSPNSSPSSAYDMCRICHCEAEVDAPLIAPCICSGSLRYVHQACLQQWIKSSDTKKCELCKFEFRMQTKTKPFREWDRLEMSAVERRKIFCSVTFHVVAITCVVWSLYVLIDRTAEEMKTGALEWPFWTKLIVVAIGFTGGLVFMYVQCKMYVQLCRRWRAYNRIIFVENAPPKTSMVSAPTLPSPVMANSGSPTSNTASVCLEPPLPMTSVKVETCVTTSPNGTSESVMPTSHSVVASATQSQVAALRLTLPALPQVPQVVSPIRCQVLPQLPSPASPTSTASPMTPAAPLSTPNSEYVHMDSSTVVHQESAIGSVSEPTPNVHSHLQRIP